MQWLRLLSFNPLFIESFNYDLMPPTTVLAFNPLFIEIILCFMVDAKAEYVFQSSFHRVKVSRSVYIRVDLLAFQSSFHRVIVRTRVIPRREVITFQSSFHRGSSWNYGLLQRRLDLSILFSSSCRLKHHCGCLWEFLLSILFSSRVDSDAREEC